MDRADELERFKTDINFVEYASSQGYQVIKKESSKASTVMADGQGDKIVVATAEDGHGIYFSVRNETENGSIIDFLQKRQGLNLGQVRRELRSWCPGCSSYRPTPEASRQPKPERSSRDRAQVLACWTSMEKPPADGHPYLLRKRKLTAKTLADPRFASMVRIDARGNAVFPHFNNDGLVGYELKNTEFTGFSKNGQKAIWHSTNLASAPRLVIVESAIDAMSHSQLHCDQDSAYLSTGGSVSEYQRALVAVILRAAADRGAEIVVATDRDDAGGKLADELLALAPSWAKVRREEPRNGKDWNDQVQARAKIDERKAGLGMP